MSFDPKKFIDREFEQELFEDMLKFDGSARILAVKDTGGMGKSHLLEKFQYRCRITKPKRTPIALIALDQLSDYSPLYLIQLLTEQLSAFNVRLDNYAKYESARLSGDFTLISSSVFLQGSNFTDAKDVKIGNIVEHADRVTLNASGTAKLTTAQEKAAQNVVIGSFFDDLKRYCAKQAVVVMFDSYEKCDPTLREWINKVFLDSLFFSDLSQLARLAFVIAGRDVPPFDSFWAEEDCAALVKSINELHKWKKEHVEECLRAHGFVYEPKQLDIFYGMIELGLPPSQVVQAMQTCLKTKAA
jgi:hypothetical protein